MKTEILHHTTTVYRSSNRPDVVTDERDLAAAIAWADGTTVWKKGGPRHG